MLTFLRKIRRSFIGSASAGESDANGVKKYFLYALGEIALVVIGILIALQINTWNEDGKKKKLEQSTLIEVNNSLQSDIQNFEDQIKFQIHSAEVSTELLHHLEDRKEHTPTLDTMWEKAVRYYLLSFNNSAFELLGSRGIDLISNVELRNQIVHHYNFDQVNLQRQLDIQQRLSDRYISYYFDRLRNPITTDFGKEFDYKKETLTPVNYQAILDDPSFIAKLSHGIKARYRLSQIITEFIAKSQNLSDEIRKELENWK